MAHAQYNSKQTILFYVIACVLFGAYGGRVCPFLETLTVSELIAQSGVVFAAMFGIRHWLSSNSHWIASKNLIVVDSVLFFLSSLPFSLFYFWVYDFPLDSNMKVVFGMTMFGFLTGFILELKSKIQLLLINDVSTNVNEMAKSKRHSMVKQAIALVVTLLLALAVTLTMIAVKDVYWLEHNPQYLLDGTGKISVIKEFIFVSAVLVIYSGYIMALWHRLVDGIFTGHVNALEEVTEGKTSQRLPVYLNDELGAVASMTNSMLDSLERSTEELETTRDAAILGLSALAESRDNETGAHILRTQEYVKSLAIGLSTMPQFKSLLTEDYIELLYKSAPLHDVGKVGIPDSVLLKPGKLTDEEFSTMKAHPQIGADALAIAEKQLGSSSFLRLAKEIALTHHEKWDGSGYPNQLVGSNIPLSGRLMALADVYDALISKRIYKPAFSHDKAKQIIMEGAGNHFDPEVVDAFLEVESEFVAIAQKHKDSEIAD